ncbi:hypothetical protein HDV64DRAFT_263820 [Trichoderma sp. TUCIM 5745]
MRILLAFMLRLLMWERWEGKNKRRRETRDAYVPNPHPPAVLSKDVSRLCGKSAWHLWTWTSQWLHTDLSKPSNRHTGSNPANHTKQIYCKDGYCDSAHERAPQWTWPMHPTHKRESHTD